MSSRKKPRDFCSPPDPLSSDAATENEDLSRLPYKRRRREALCVPSSSSDAGSVGTSTSSSRSSVIEFTGSASHPREVGYPQRRSVSVASTALSSEALSPSPEAYSSETASSSCTSDFTGNYRVLPRGRFSAVRSLSATAASRELLPFSEHGKYSATPRTVPHLFEHSHYLPSYIDNYWDLIKVRSIMLQNAAAAVRTAYEAVYGAQMASYSRLMIAALRDGLIPHEPQMTPSGALRQLQATVESDMKRFSRFASMLPGFESVGEEDRSILLAEKYLVNQMILVSRYYYKGEYYVHFNVPHGIHFSRAWMDMLGFHQEFLRLTGMCYEAINDIGLVPAEMYLLAAVAICAPDVTTVRNRALLSSIHAFYLDALYYQIGNRILLPGRAIIYGKVERILQMLQTAQGELLGYVINLDKTCSAVRSQPALLAGFHEPP